MNIYRPRSVKFNFLMNTILKCSGAVFSVISYALAFRVLGAESSGKVAFSITVCSFFSVVAMLGVPTYGVRECARVRNDRCQLSQTVHELLSIQIIMTGFTTLVLGLSVQHVPKLYAENRLFIIQGCVLLANAFNLEWLFEGLEQYTYITLRSVFVKSISVLLVLLAVHSPSDYMVYASLLALGAILPNMLNIFSANHFIKWTPKKAFHGLGRHWKPTLIFFAQTAAITAYTSFDSVMLGFMKSDTYVGIYDAAAKVKLILSYFLTSLSAVLLPRLSYYISTQQEKKFQQKIFNSMEFLLVAGLPLSVFSAIAAPEIITFLFGSTYTASVQVLQILSPAIFLIGLSSLIGQQILIPTGKEKIAMNSYIAGAAVDIGMNLLLIPGYGAAGAAAGTLIAELTVFSVQAVYINKMILPAFRQQKIAAVILGTAVAACLLCIIRRNMCMPLYFKLPMEGFVYFGSVIAVLVIAKEPLVMQGIRKVIGSVRHW